MDSQLKKGILDSCVLFTIKREESYGYKIISNMSKYIEISESTLYPILKRLENMGAVKVRNKEYNGRLRKYYSITEIGIQKIEDFKEDLKEIKSIYDYIIMEDRC